MSGHGGNTRNLAAIAGVSPEDLLDFSANINPLGPPAWLRSVISRSLDSLQNYPDPENSELLEALADKWSVDKGRLIAGNGANELIFTIPRALPIDRVIVCPPAYIDYKNAALKAEREVIEIQLLEDFSLDWSKLDAIAGDNDLLVLAHPNNPTGNLLDLPRLRQFLKEHESTYVMLDEAFIDFVGEEFSLIQENIPNLIITRSFTKFYAIPGLRLGCLIAAPAVIAMMKEKMFSWSVNTLAQSVGIEAIKDDEYQRQTIAAVREYRQQLTEKLQQIDALEVFPSTVNYLLCRLLKGDARRLAGKMLKDFAIAIRVCDNYPGLDSSYFRVAVKTPQHNDKLLIALKSCLSGKKIVNKTPKPHPSLMFQGTSSNAGKSIITAAFCRIMLQDGLNISPFKSQNMALNSFVTRDGLEIARAQVVQAQAARLDPDIRMNPILLKPNSNRLTQVILNGKVVGDYSWRDYIKFKPQAFEAVKESYTSLCKDYDAILLEGAGSPAEVNLKHSDIVNMGMAAYSQSPVMLVGDIDRGGIFASFIGTMDILTAEERKLVAGFLVNRFRGDASLLQGALDLTFNHTGKPVWGVIPYVPNLNLPEEDSLSFREAAMEKKTNPELDIVIIDTPRIANFTDFDPLDVEADVQLRLVSNINELGNPDAIILAGSKGTIADFVYLQKKGFGEEILAKAAAGTQIIGICGGFQMLGEFIEDPLGIESPNGSIRALGLLKATTTMAADKTLKRVETIHLQERLAVSGYEIHHGNTINNGSQVIFENDGDILGLASESGTVWGTYLHGIFDDDKFRRHLLNKLRRNKGLSPIEAISPYNLEPAFDLLAEKVRESVDMKAIYKKMGL